LVRGGGGRKRGVLSIERVKERNHKGRLGRGVLGVPGRGKGKSKKKRGKGEQGDWPLHHPVSKKGTTLFPSMKKELLRTGKYASGQPKNLRGGDKCRGSSHHH